ncbi:MAG: hypothetical protein KA020_14160, partial [Planctomycetes bacterium]|nr:hypothetical protein [Planctomycetota bacterium]
AGVEYDPSDKTEGKSYDMRAIAVRRGAPKFRADLLAALEVNGFTRSPEIIALDDVHRNAILGRLRSDRLQRSGKPSLNRDLLTRDVIASQRIEDVDARRWLLR